MGFETERKFLVKGDFYGEVKDKEEIIQAYLMTDPERTIRIRLTGDKAFITIKSKTQENLIRRAEWEFSIPFQDAEELMSLCIPGKIIKTRYFIPSGEHTFEVDVFHDKNEGLIIAEIELKDESEHFIRPEWLGEEVTGNPLYYNSNLIK